MHDVQAILNLLYIYAERIDSGDLDGAAALFTHARVKMQGASGNGTVDAAGVREVWEHFIALYPDGTPRTKHVITNPIVDIDDAGIRAACRSYYTVVQQTDDYPLQVVCAGRYHDEFEKVDGAWRYCYRDYSLLDLVGDFRAHAKSGDVYGG
jgi:3-phenylpropionate/cinnamic acid dioxygenase small subunit